PLKRIALLDCCGELAKSLSSQSDPSLLQGSAVVTSAQGAQPLEHPGRQPDPWPHTHCFHIRERGRIFWTPELAIRCQKQRLARLQRIFAMVHWNGTSQSPQGSPSQSRARQLHSTAPVPTHAEPPPTSPAISLVLARRPLSSCIVLRRLACGLRMSSLWGLWVTSGSARAISSNSSNEHLVRYKSGLDIDPHKNGLKVLAWQGKDLQPSFQ
ncbi:MAG: hypothetical protein M1830_001276, partial [Pleopsidium flavum]